MCTAGEFIYPRKRNIYKGAQTYIDYKNFQYPRILHVDNRISTMDTSDIITVLNKACGRPELQVCCDRCAKVAYGIF